MRASIAVAGAALALLFLPRVGFAQQAPDGATIFASNCASCHNGVPENRAPAPDVLRQRSPEAILSALTAGGMRPQGGRLSGVERRAVAEFLTGKAFGSDITGVTAASRCSADQAAATALRLLSTGPPSSGEWRGWSPSPANTRIQTAEAAGLTAATVPRLTLKWAFGFPDATSAWSQPTVAGGRVFVGSQNGTVYALDATSGCVYWTFTAKSGVRTAPIVGGRPAPDGSAAAARTAIFFGDTGANVYALDATTGSLLWSTVVDAHPFARVTGTPTLYEDRLYVPVSSLEETAASQPGYECCTFRGSLAALDTRTGNIIWQTYMVGAATQIGRNPAGTPLWAPAGVGVWSSPTIDVKRHLVYIGTGNTYSGTAAEPLSDSIVALDPASGAIKWSRQVTSNDVFGCRAGSANCLEKAGPDFDFGTPPMLITLPGGRDVLVVAQKSGMAYALDPEKAGATIWQYKAGEGSIWGGIQWGAAIDAENVYLPVSDIRTPKPGGLHAVSIFTGERVWYQPPPALKCSSGTGCSAALISAPTLIPGVLFSGSNDGGLRAHATKDGSVIWEFDTNREFQTVNGVTARGGSIQGPGPTIAAGMLYLNAGYGDHLGRAGNVLLAFGVQ